MGSAPKLFSALFAIFFLALVEKNLAQNAPEDFVNAHNAVRAKVVGPMTWDTTVAAYAQNYANKRIADCKLVHSDGDYGENILLGSTGTATVYSWAAEEYYNYTNNTCAPGKVCGHYTQVVWAKSVQLGCARVKCNNGVIFIICNYNPPGNYIGERPY